MPWRPSTSTRRTRRPPAASVSGFYLAHPQAAYFNVGRIGDDQAEDWARRQAMDITAARRHLSTLL